MGLDGDDTTPDILRCAVLCYQLPRDGRVWRATNPALAHDTATQLLRQIELDLRTWHWANTDSAKDESTRPEPIMLDGEEEAIERRVDEQIEAAAEIARRLGL